MSHRMFYLVFKNNKRKPKFKEIKNNEKGVKEVTDEVVESIPGIVGKVSKFEDRKLTPEEKIIFFWLRTA